MKATTYTTGGPSKGPGTIPALNDFGFPNSRSCLRFIHKSAPLLVFLLLLSGCAPKLLIREDASLKELAVCLEISASIPDSVKNSFDSVTQAFMVAYNSVHSKYHLIPCQNNHVNTMYLDVFSVRITDPPTQYGGVFLTMLGVALPIIMISMDTPFYIGFYYLPHSNAQINMKLSEDIAEGGQSVVRTTAAQSPEYFGSYQEQKEFLLQSYYNRLEQEFIDLDSRD